MMQVRRITAALMGICALLVASYIGMELAEPGVPVTALGALYATPPGESLSASGASVSTPVNLQPRAPTVPGGPVGDVEIVIDGDRELYLPLESVFMLPDDSVFVRVAGAGPGQFDMSQDDGRLEGLGGGNWVWHPSFTDGRADLTLRNRTNGSTFVLRAWRLTPRSEFEDGWIGSFRVGRYPSSPLGGNPIYLPPPGLVKVTEANRDVRVSPRFRIGQFVSKQSPNLPSYLILRTQLLLKLEVLLDALTERGYSARSFHVMSGYRTPHYNVNVLGNVQYSRHQWGGAADVFVDERPRNGYMDDLNGDGRVGLEDIRRITMIVDSLENELESFPIGGAGVYRANSVRGPFVHIDVRGQRARW